MKHLYFFLFALACVFFTNTINAQGNCNETDLLWLNDNLETAQSVAIDCGISCLFNPDSELCMQDCMGEQTPLSSSCITCFSDQLDCTLANCLADCIGGVSEACQDCLTEFCGDDFVVCIGLVDSDEDGYNVLEDCNDEDDAINPGATEIWYDGVDQNCDGLDDYDQDMDGEVSADYGGSDCNDLDAAIQGGMILYFLDGDNDGYGNTFSFVMSCAPVEGMVENDNDCDDERNDVYPGAVGTGEGIDNDCNGVVEEDELFACPGDFDDNLLINAADLLFLLADFGCEVNCQANLGGDEAVSTDDLLIFLSMFGEDCF